MKSELSSLLDDELESERQLAVLAALHSDPELRAAWGQYHLIGDALRRTPKLHVDLTDRVMAELQREPAILVPQTRENRGVQFAHGALRYAAALAGVAVVGWLALSGPQTASQTLPATLTRSVVRPEASEPAQVAQAANANRMQSYVVAHRAYAPSNRLDGGAGYVRTVVATR